MIRGVLLAAALLCSINAQAMCFAEAASRYGVNPILLSAIAEVETSTNPAVVTRNKNGSLDVGLMGINTVHLEELGKRGITVQHLMDPCYNVMIGAWMLSKHIAARGVTWEAVGAYHSKTPSLRDRYSEKVRKVVMRKMETVLLAMNERGR